MPFKREYYQSTIPEVLTIKDRTYVTLELINQARKRYKESREIINLYNKRSLKTAYHRSIPGQPRYTREDAEFCATDRKSTRLNSSHIPLSRMPSSA